MTFAVCLTGCRPLFQLPLDPVIFPVISHLARSGLRLSKNGISETRRGHTAYEMSMLEVEKHETFSVHFPRLARRQHSRLSSTQGSHQNRMITTRGPLPGLLEEASG